MRTMGDLHSEYGTWEDCSFDRREGCCQVLIKKDGCIILLAFGTKKEPWEIYEEIWQDPKSTPTFEYRSGSQNTSLGYSSSVNGSWKSNGTTGWYCEK